LRCSNIDQDFAKREKDVKKGREKREREERRRERAKANTTYPPTHTFIIKNKVKVGLFIQLYVIQAYK
jgi:hypothetical protein